MRGKRVDPVELRRRIDARRIERGWTMQQFIAETGRSSALVYAILDGVRQPSLLTAAALARILDCAIEDFTVPAPGSPEVTIDLPQPSDTGDR